MSYPGVAIEKSVWLYCVIGVIVGNVETPGNLDLSKHGTVCHVNRRG